MKTLIIASALLLSGCAGVGDPGVAEYNITQPYDVEGAAAARVLWMPQIKIIEDSSMAKHVDVDKKGNLVIK